jgi:type II secretory pathway pseudopilin PulG
MKRLVGVIVLGLCAASALAKLPPPSDEAKAKAAEAAAKTAYGDKVAAYQLCKSMDKVAATYLADAKKSGKDVKPVATPPCTDPGPFSYTPPGQKPLEASGAHSPPGNATSPPSNKTPAADHAPAKKS